MVMVDICDCRFIQVKIKEGDEIEPWFKKKNRMLLSSLYKKKGGSVLNF